MLINIERERDKSIYYRNIYDTTTIFTLTHKTQTLSDNNNSQSEEAPIHRIIISQQRARTRSIKREKEHNGYDQRDTQRERTRKQQYR